MGITCLLAGFWAGNVISIQYYEEQNAVPSRRVTSMDGEIHNVLERVLKDVYESELPPLHSEQNDTTTSNTTTQAIVTSRTNHSTHSMLGRRHNGISRLEYTQRCHS